MYPTFAPSQMDKTISLIIIENCSQLLLLTVLPLPELAFMLPLFWSGFPSSVRCDVTNATVSNVEPDAYKDPLYCTIPTAGYAQVIFLLNLVGCEFA